MKRQFPFLLCILAFAVLALGVSAAEAGVPPPADSEIQPSKGIIAILVPILVAIVKFIVPKIPAMWLPILCPVLGAALDVLIYLSGMGGLSPGTGVLLGLAGNGVREVYDQVKKAMPSSP